MIVNEFENTREYRFQQIVNTLKNIHGYQLELDSKDKDQIRSLHESCELIKNSIVKESSFNSWMQNPEYTKNMLIMEAIKIYLTEIAPRRMNKRSKKVRESQELDEITNQQIVDMNQLGHKMIDYSQAQRPPRNNEREMRILNAISNVGDKLTRLGSPFGPKTLSDMDRRVIEVAKRRMGLKPNPEDSPSMLGLSETGAQPAPAIPGKPQPTAPNKPGMIKMKKNNQEKDVPANQIDSLRKQGWNVMGDINENAKKITPELAALMKQYGVNNRSSVNENAKKITPELAALMKQYGVDGMDEGNKFSGARQAAIDAGEDDFEVDGKSYKVTGQVNEDWGSSDWTAAINYMDRYLKDGPINPDTITDAALSTAEFYHDSMGYDDVEDAKNSIIRMWMIRKGWHKLLGESVELNKSTHMEHHDDYQADMARSELYRNTKYAMDMMKMINPDDDVKPWILSGLTKAANYLDKIYHYMDYHITFKSQPSNTDVEIDENNTEPDLTETTGGAARQNLLMIMEYSTKLFRMIQPNDRLEGWVVMKLTTASECVSSAKHYLDYAQFERHAGDQTVDLDKDAVPVRENKKKTVKEGRLVNIENILMKAMLREEQDLDQAQTLLAAKSMSDEMQSMAEKLAKMSVEDLMPLVDTMKEQFGQDIANGFNSVVKSALETVLGSMTTAKETTDNAILSMQQGQVPGMETDIETAQAPDLQTEPTDDFEATPPASGEKTEPLGRKKKSKSKDSDEDLVDIEEGKKPMTAKQAKFFGKKSDKDKLKESNSDEVSVWFYFPFNVSTYRAIEDRIEAAVGIDSDGSGTDFKERDVSFTFKDRAAAHQAIRKVKALKIKGLRHKLISDIDEAKKAVEPGAVATAQVMKMKGKFVTKDGKHLTKAGIKKRVEIIRAIEREQKVEESRTRSMLNAAKQTRKELVKTLAEHKRKHARMVSEGIVKDPLNVGYGIEGQGIIDQIGETDQLISRLNAIIKAELKETIRNISEARSRSRKAKRLEEAKKAAPYGVSWKSGRTVKNKFFESADQRRYWMDLNSDILKNPKLIEPADFDNQIQKLKV